ncbi:hypothetical protein BJ912DRAFT_928160 [Pholiota molesta]|nr:hypothetical protein BJ912DRAFT_928160 [Pholiota molesta]
MRWTYTFLIATYLLLTAHSTAQPVSSAVQHADTVQLSRREPFPGRQKRQRSSSPIASGSHSAKRQKSRSRSNSESSVGPPSSASIDSPGPPSPKKQRRSRHPASNIRTVDLKSDDYRKQAIAKEPPRSDWQGFDADHILEPQTVTYYLNNHRGSGVVDKKCIKALKAHLNHKSNLKMLDKDSNQNASCFLFRFHDKYYTTYIGFRRITSWRR